MRYTSQLLRAYSTLTPEQTLKETISVLEQINEYELSLFLFSSEKTYHDFLIHFMSIEGAKESLNTLLDNRQMLSYLKVLYGESYKIKSLDFMNCLWLKEPSLNPKLTEMLNSLLAYNQKFLFFYMTTNNYNTRWSIWKYNSKDKTKVYSYMIYDRAMALTIQKP